ncbi:D-glutamate cyclase, mitochondrial isoform X1 [Lethenteron reissneri]|uniref:D-glutamate cyclase, mitochondrial isoform X1 n=1 Tax=Lethenteron reissneri TaxID=7753 RepID=UPI002AB78D1C|nr:D-glutamate cyclase, mitochondrial isoform X1 [Lethenteron reissneri]XP_061424589.1 D-glutamate cyclase, mitochondrial isoform X1 [Lethenteron reissneri]
MELSPLALGAMDPAEVRRLIRSGQLRGRSTSGMAEGFTQANLVVVEESVADEFERFCRANAGPLPLLYRSQPDEWAAPPLAAHSDIRTDCPGYRRYEHGQLTGLPDSLPAPGPNPLVSFYLGCSFSFERLLLEAGIPVRNVQQGRNVSMYRTSARCEVAGRFDCRLVVSMRPVPEASLGPACRLTHPRQDVHGAPVHIGDPGLLGIRDLSVPDFGDSVSSDPGDVPVFWACGVTGVEAVQSAHLSLAFTHAPGCMFVTDVKGQSAEPVPEQGEEGEAGAPEVVCVSRDPLLYSLVSAGAASAVHALERHVQLDPGSRGIKHLHVPGELLHAALSLSHSRSVLLITGFPTHVTQQPPEETDGPPGALAMAAALRALGKRVALATDARAAGLMRDIVTDALREGVLDEEVPVVTMEGRGQDAARAFLLEDGPEGPTPRYDHLVAIERAGAAADGCYYNARKINIGHLVDPLDELFWLARDTRGVSTTGIGDGGNELGMGRVSEAVRAHIKNGDVIACAVPADFTITTGVSNWGGYAVACALYLLRTCAVHERYLRRAVGAPASLEQRQAWSRALPSVQKEEALLAILARHGVRSGVTGTLGMEVDGLPFRPTHSDMIEALLKILPAAT